jgi:hypothetical protein
MIGISDDKVEEAEVAAASFLANSAAISLCTNCSTFNSWASSVQKLGNINIKQRKNILKKLNMLKTRFLISNVKAGKIIYYKMIKLNFKLNIYYRNIDIYAKFKSQHFSIHLSHFYIKPTIIYHPRGGCCHRLSIFPAAGVLRCCR